MRGCKLRRVTHRLRPTASESGKPKAPRGHELAHFGEEVTWQPTRPRLRADRIVVSWVVAADGRLRRRRAGSRCRPQWFGGAFVVAAAIAALNAVLPPFVASLRLPFALISGFLAVLVVDAGALLVAHELFEAEIRVDSPGSALGGGAGDRGCLDRPPCADRHQRRRRIRPQGRAAGRATPGGASAADVAGIIFLEIDGLALPVLRNAMRDGSAPTMARWVAERGYRLTEREPDLSSQTGASQAGILLGSNEDIPAFRSVEKEAGRLISCSTPGDCAEIERRRAARAWGCWSRAAPSRGTCSRVRPTR